MNIQPARLKPIVFPWLGLVALLLTAWMAYRPGMHGGFLFDDAVNLSALGKYGPVDSWPSFLRYITAGFADPTGRPLSMLSFLLDGRTWPTDPAPFLRTNILLHIANGALLFALLRELERHLHGAGSRTDSVALLGAGLWLLHPLLVSTTLYVVQREAMLPATFVLMGLIAYVYGRRLHVTQPKAGACWMIFGIGAGTALAVLAKANGVLLPLLAGVLELTVLRAGDRTLATATAHRLRSLQWPLLWIPSASLFVLLLAMMPPLNADLEPRPWTIAQRLLTEPRVLLDYLKLLLVPRAISSGVYNDGFVVSSSLLQPTSTFIALSIVLLLIASGWIVRRRAPALSAAILFYFSGHLLESTVIPLELYFEHRNYLPAMLLFWPMARALFGGAGRPALRGAAAVGLLAMCALLTNQRAELWGKPEEMAQLWALQNPGSSRAQATAASVEMRAGEPQRAMQRLAPLWQQQPHDLQLALNYADAACAVRGLTQGEIAAIEVALRRATQGHLLLFHWLNSALDLAADGSCPGLDFATVQRWLAAAGANPIMRGAGRKQDLESLAGRMAMQQRKPDLALAHFDRALAAYVTPNAAAMQAAMLASSGYYTHALAHLDHYQRIESRAERAEGWSMRRVHEALLDAQGYWPYELGLLREKLHAEIAAQPQAASNTTGQR